MPAASLTALEPFHGIDSHVGEPGNLGLLQTEKCPGGTKGDIGDFGMSGRVGSRELRRPFWARPPRPASYYGFANPALTQKHDARRAIVVDECQVRFQQHRF